MVQAVLVLIQQRVLAGQRALAVPLGQQVRVAVWVLAVPPIQRVLAGQQALVPMVQAVLALIQQQVLAGQRALAPVVQRELAPTVQIPLQELPLQIQIQQLQTQLKELVK